MDKVNKAELAHKFLENKLSEQERLFLQEKISSDPSFKEEFSLQKDTINVLREFRKSQIKQRLESIEVGIGIGGFIAGLKLIHWIFISGVISVVSFFVVTSENPEYSEPSSLVTFNDQHIIDANKTLPELPKPKIEPIPAATEERTYKKNQATDELIVERKNEDIREVIQPEAIQPEVLENFPDQNADPDFPDDLAIENPATALLESDNDQLGVEAVSSEEFEFHYMYFENKLFLYGSFGSTPYEIMEMNSSNGKKVFMYHNGDFFQIKENTRQPSALTKIENTNLIEELQIARKLK